MDFSNKYDARPSTELSLSTELLSSLARSLNLKFNSRSSIKTTKLGGGFSNTNYLLEFDEGFSCVARVSSEHQRLEKEKSLFEKLANDLPIPKLLYTKTRTDDFGPGCIVMEFVEGQMMADIEDHLSISECQSLAEQIGRYAADIHNVRYKENGFLGVDAQVSSPFPSYREGTVGFLEHCLANETFASRIGPSRANMLGKLLTSREELHLPAATEQLCHGDFNQKNILVAKNIVGQWQVSAILDWEFALSASGIMDIANFLRFDLESPIANADWLANAYRGAGGLLSDNWRLESIFSDLMAQCSFLIEPPHRPKTHATAINVLDRYFQLLG